MKLILSATAVLFVIGLICTHLLVWALEITLTCLVGGLVALVLLYLFDTYVPNNEKDIDEL